MPTDRNRVTRAQRTLAAELERLRLRAELSMREFNKRALGDREKSPTPHARIRRIETAQARPSQDQVAHWLDATDSTPGDRERVWGLFEEVRTGTQSWSSLLDDSPTRELQRLAAEREEAATGVDEFDHQWVPGLLQTASYARALFGVLARDGYDIDVPVASDRRMRRQELLHEPGRTFRFLLTRRALVWNPDPDEVSLAGQVDRIRELASLPAVDVRVLADDAVPVAGWSSFTLYEGDQSFVSIELEHRSVLAFDEDDVARYRRRFAALWAAADPL